MKRGCRGFGRDKAPFLRERDSPDRAEGTPTGANIIHYLTAGSLANGFLLKSDESTEGTGGTGGDTAGKKWEDGWRAGPFA